MQPLVLFLVYYNILVYVSRIHSFVRLYFEVLKVHESTSQLNRKCKVQICIFKLEQ